MTRRHVLRAVIVLMIAAALVAAWLLGLHDWLQLDALKDGVDRLGQWRDSAPLIVAGAYFALYVVVTAVSLPGAAVMTLAGGALFGLWWGTLLVSFASSLGALLAFLAARTVLRDTVERRFGERLRTINTGIAREGGFYLFTLRLVPLFPFFVINLVMGLTAIKAGTFYLVSQVGMLAGTLVYVNAGTQLARIDSLGGILSPTLLLSFALLGLFPLVARRLVDRWRRRRLYARWRRPARFDRNLMVIGAGAAGLVSAYIGVAVKARVTLVEAQRMGGDCLNYGCVPSKALIRTATLAHQIRHGGHFGLRDAEPQCDFHLAMRRVHEVIARVAPHDSVERYRSLGVEVLTGQAHIVDPWTVRVRDAAGADTTLTTRSIIIAAGARPRVPDIPGIETSGYLTSDTLWEALAARAEAPQRLVVIGGGPIGCELAQCFARLGIAVTIVQRAERLLPREDDEVSQLVGEALKSDGVEVLTACQTRRCEQGAGGPALIVDHHGQERRLAYDVLLCAVGRQARIEGYGLEDLGIETRGTVLTDAWLQTRLPNIYAAGDVTGPYQFTHAAAHQAWYATVNALFGDLRRFAADYRVLPWCTFVAPEVAGVGLNERAAQAQGIAYEVLRYEIDDLDRALTDGEATGFVKVLTVPGKDRIIGVTIVSAHAGEMLAEFVLAMRHGLGLNKILATVHTYPTWAEANKYVAGRWKAAHAPARILRWIERYHRWRRG